MRSRIAVAVMGVVLAGSGPGWAEGRNESEKNIVAFAVDTSGSVRGEDLARARTMVEGVRAALPAGAEVALVTFDDEARVVLPPTTKASDLAAALGTLRPTGRHTAMNDALFDTARLLSESSATRRALVLVTDGRDEDSAVDLADGLAVAQDAGVPVFTVGVGRVDERVLRRIAKLTGGRYTRLSATSPASLAAAIGKTGVTHVAGISADSPAVAASVDAPPSRISRVLAWMAVFALGAPAFYAWRRRRPAVPVTTMSDAEAATLVERMNRTEEYLEKTVTLRERPVLAVTRGPGAGEVYELKNRGPLSIGRARANEVVVNDVSVSSEHCRIRTEDGRFVVHDLKSTNGTFVNERRVSRHVLAEGDVVKIGETAMLFKMDFTPTTRPSA